MSSRFLVQVSDLALGVPGINPEAAAAHAANESGYGTSQLSSAYNNLFGLKQGSNWSGQTVLLPTWEVIQGKNVQIEASFRVYPSWKESVKDYAEVIRRLYPWAAKHTYDPVTFLFGVFQRGPLKWATDPNALAKAVNILEVNKLLPQEANQHQLGIHEVWVDNSPTVGSAIATAVASVKQQPAIHQTPIKVTRTRRADGTWKLDIRRV